MTPKPFAVSIPLPLTVSVCQVCGVTGASQGPSFPLTWHSTEGLCPFSLRSHGLYCSKAGPAVGFLMYHLKGFWPSGSSATFWAEWLQMLDPPHFGWARTPLTAEALHPSKLRLAPGGNLNNRLGQVSSTCVSLSHQRWAGRAGLVCAVIRDQDFSVPKVLPSSSWGRAHPFPWRSWPIRCTCHFYPLPTGQNLVSRRYLGCRGGWEMSLLWAATCQPTFLLPLMMVTSSHLDGNIQPSPWWRFACGWNQDNIYLFIHSCIYSLSFIHSTTQQIFDCECWK